MVRRALLAVTLLAFAALVVAARQDPPFEDEIRRFEAADRANPPAPGAALFVGSSSIRLWSTLAQDFPEVRTLNRGFGGSQIADSVRLVDRIVTPYRPKAIVFFAGTNDLAAGKSPETVLADYNAFVTKVRDRLPDVPIAFIAITPAPSRWANLANVKRANALVKTYSSYRPGLRFIDTYPLFLTPEGGPRPELFVGDQLHLRPEGYAIWRAAVGPVVREMVGSR